MNTAFLVRLNEVTNRTFVLPVVVFFPTSRCNSRCVSCDWWKASGDGDLSVSQVEDIADALPSLGTRIVLFSGGEPLLRPEVFELAGLFTSRGITLHLHTSGILLERFVEPVARRFSRVIVSLDSPDENGYRAIRGVSALQTLERGVAALRALRPALPVTARSTLHRANFRELPRLIEHARAMCVDQISFLAADVTAHAFGRLDAPAESTLALTREEIAEFGDVVERTIVDAEADFVSGFVAESPDKLRRLPQYYAALAGLAPFPPVECNAPYMSVVIEADGSVRPCFFHKAIGNVRDTALPELVRRHLPHFRAGLDVGKNRVCERCVCAIRTGFRSAPWQ
jgi:MoaA/NifB/PqqE/SkfB family radical SAM enzyme